MPSAGRSVGPPHAGWHVGMVKRHMKSKCPRLDYNEYVKHMVSWGILGASYFVKKACDF